MPFIAREQSPDGDLVVPEDVADGEDVFCPKCDGRMRTRGGTETVKARHFWHIENLGDGDGGRCSGVGEYRGESDTHRHLKKIAVAGLWERFQDHPVSNCDTEVPIDVSMSTGPTDYRRADALLEFQDENPFFGRGVVVEVQYANEDKNIPRVSADIVSAGYSILWTERDDYSQDQFDTGAFDEAFDERDRSAFAPYFATETSILELFDLSKWYNLGSKWGFEDPKCECSHEFEYGSDAHRCLRCGIGYKLHKESQLPIYTAPDHDVIPNGILEVTGGDDTLEPDGTPHVHRWRYVDRPSSGRERCMTCSALKRTGSGGEVTINYHAMTFDEFETRQMKHCSHEWRRTGHGEECWKCGKEKPKRRY